MGKVDFIKLKFKGKVYEDGVRDGFGHIRFGSNVYEYVPADDIMLSRLPHVIMHGYRQKDNGYVHTSKTLYDKVEILD